MKISLVADYIDSIKQYSLEVWTFPSEWEYAFVLTERSNQENHIFLAEVLAFKKNGDIWYPCGISPTEYCFPSNPCYPVTSSLMPDQLYPGQWILHLDTPYGMVSVECQNILYFHNLKSDLFRL